MFSQNTNELSQLRTGGVLVMWVLLSLKAVTENTFTFSVVINPIRYPLLSMMLVYSIPSNFDTTGHGLPVYNESAAAAGRES